MVMQVCLHASTTEAVCQYVDNNLLYICTSVLVFTVQVMHSSQTGECSLSDLYICPTTAQKETITHTFNIVVYLMPFSF